MLPERYRWITAQFEPEGDPWLLLDIARILEQEGNLEGAATVYDRAFGLEPDAAEIREGRQRILDQLAVVEHGLVFRYVPAGPFLMGSNDGDQDERPVHPVWLSPYWLTDTPLSWEAYCRLMDWEPPPTAWPREPETASPEFSAPQFCLANENKIRWYYCDDRDPDVRRAAREPQGQELPPEGYGLKPMVAVSWQAAQELADRLTNARVRYTLPTEAEWEKAARGGLIGARHAWGNSAPTPALCDYNRFRPFRILPMRSLPANGYGLFAMNGGVWEWTRDWYDCDYYHCTPDTDPEGPAQGKEKVLRGGSWTDCAEAVTVTFRMSRTSVHWREDNERRGWGGNFNPNVGFRLCRMRTG